MIQQFEHLIKEFANGTLNRGRFVASFNQFLRLNPSADQADLLKAIKQAKKDEVLGNDQSTFLNETVKMSLASQQLGGIESTIVPTELLDREDDTLIYNNSDSSVDSAFEETAISQTRITSNDDDIDEDVILDDDSGKSETVMTIGSVIKGRFVLTELLGRGGMGVVYKARDLVKVQARDSNPYVAVKVLTDAFKKHSSSFIALQREASKAQRLAHPNIATVFDFDHDAGAVYMTMELMVGQNLQKLIKEMPKDGLPKDVALNYIRQLAAGLAYAHKQQLIHCDLKPANIFLTNDGTIKLLDFGITRAIKRDKDLDEDTTVFDPKVLKALTPAYASIEMFSGQDPDPRDDIYALGCVAHELLTGVHPYKKVPAHKAKELNLKPPAIKKLARKEQKAVHNLLELERKKRTPSIDQFLHELSGAKSYIKELLIAAVAVVALGIIFLAKPIINQFQEDKQLQTIKLIQDGNQSALISLLTELPDMDFNTRISLTSILRKEIIQHYQTQINDAIDASKQNYNFPEAFKLLNEVKQIYPDSASLVEAHNSLTLNRDRLVAALENKYVTIKSVNGRTGRIISILREADPYHRLLRQTKRSR